MIQERDSLHGEVEKLGVQLEQTKLGQRTKVVDSQEFQEVKNENKQLTTAVQRLEKDMAAAREAMD